MKKTVILTLLLSLSLLSVEAQEHAADNTHYAKQYERLYKQYMKDPDNVAHNLSLAEFYADTINPMRNYASAMKYITFAEKHYIAIVEDRDKYREVSKLIKQKITVASVRQTKQHIIDLCAKVLSDDTPMTEGTLNNYAEALSGNPTLLQMVENKRIHMQYLQAKKMNTMQAFKVLYDNYPATSEGEAAAQELARLAKQKVATVRSEDQVDTLLGAYLYIPSVQNVATARKSAIAYDNLLKSPTPQAYREFLKKYPGSNEYDEVLERADDMMAQEFAELSTPRQFADFAIENPDNPLSDKAMESLKNMITQERDITALKIYMEEFPLDVNYNDIYLQYYRWHTEEGSKAPIENFIERHPDFPYKMAIADEMASGERRDQYNINKPYYEEEFNSWKNTIYQLTGKKVSFVALQRTLQQYIAAKSWNKITDRIAFFGICFEKVCDDEVAELKSIVLANENPRLSMSTMVQPAYNLEHPVLHPDGKHLYYHRNDDGTKSLYVAVLQATKKGSIWRSIGKVRFSNIENVDVSAYSFFDHGNKMLLGQNGNILVGEFNDTAWSVMQMPEPVNSAYNDFDAIMLPDSSGMLIASDRPEGYNMQRSRSYFHGDTALASDIYYIPLTSAGWGTPVNLGMHVNTPYMECSPSISSDLKTLYFITDGRGGLGYGDLYYTTRDNVDDWNHWSTPVNYGKQVNTGFNEASAVLDPNGKSLTISSNAHGKYGSYSVTAMHTISSNLKPITLTTTEIGLTFDIYDQSTSKKVLSQATVAANSRWTSSFYSNKQYVLLPHCNGVLMPGIVFQPSTQQQLKAAVYDFTSLTQLALDNKPLLLPALCFEENTSKMKPYAEQETDHLADFMLRHPAAFVELKVHVAGDDDAACFELSQQRGQEIKKRLVADGVNPDNIAVSGYGNSFTKRNSATTSVAIMVTEIN